MDKSPDAIQVLIADDHPILRDGLRKLIDANQDMTVVGEAGDGVEAVRLARRLKPDILLLDVAMPRKDGMDVLRDLLNSGLSVRTILLTAAVERRQVVEALQLGACGVVLKESSTELLIKSIRSVMAGQFWLEQGSVADLVQALRDSALPGTSSPERRKFSLTARELEIIKTIVAGYTNKDIAEKFSLSEHTVKHHLTNIFDKLGVSNRLELALFVVDHHLVGRE
ncbi:MAG TPA: response regulator transcription factor [Terriglobia bacterium]|jgi:DNA-binding NarL/FixJ family response regulator|nr:response regulator transcription factor [Terriglobia bacterium]